MQNIRLTDFQEQTDTAELSRQQQYLTRAGMHAQELAQQLGRKPTFHVSNFGCQMNTEHGKRKAAKTAAFSYGVVFRDKGERKRGRISPSGRTGSEVRS